jgi:hypothetical protein
MLWFRDSSRIHQLFTRRWSVADNPLHLVNACYFVVRQITAPGKCTVRQLIQPVALELHICEFRLRTSDTLALLSPHAEASLLDGDTIILEDATRVRDERGGNPFAFPISHGTWLTFHDAQRPAIKMNIIYQRPSG